MSNLKYFVETGFAEDPYGFGEDAVQNERDENGIFWQRNHITLNIYAEAEELAKKMAKTFRYVRVVVVSTDVVEHFAQESDPWPC